MRKAFEAGKETIWEDLAQTTRCPKYDSFEEWFESQAKKEIIKPKSTLFSVYFKKIPLLISKDDELEGAWRAEIPDNYEYFKSVKYEDINFEDLSFHFFHPIDSHEKDHLLFSRRKDAVECAKFVNQRYLNNKGKIWFL